MAVPPAVAAMSADTFGPSARASMLAVCVRLLVRRAWWIGGVVGGLGFEVDELLLLRARDPGRRLRGRRRLASSRQQQEIRGRAVQRGRRSVEADGAALDAVHAAGVGAGDRFAAADRGRFPRDRSPSRRVARGDAHLVGLDPHLPAVDGSRRHGPRTAHAWGRTGRTGRSVPRAARAGTRRRSAPPWRRRPASWDRCARGRARRAWALQPARRGLVPAPWTSTTNPSRSLAGDRLQPRLRRSPWLRGTGAGARGALGLFSHPSRSSCHRRPPLN